MKKLIVVLVVATAVCSSVVLAESLGEKVREAALVTYVHGINQEIADREIGPAGVPILLDLLRDPDFPRRDNVVAFLVYLAQDRDATALVSLLDNPPVDNDRPEEFRAKLMVPEALGHIAARGGVTARELLTRMENDSEVRSDPALAQQVDYGLLIMDDQLELVEPEYPEPGEGQPFDPSGIDGSPASHLIGMTYANHVDTNTPMRNSDLDPALEDVSFIMNFEHAPEDMACCIKLEREGDNRSFGVPGDGLDVITTSAELSAVINNPISRVKVVDYIGWCGGPGSGIIGCGYTPGHGMVVVRMSSAHDEGLLWAHELGHNTGLPHNSTPGFIMFASFSSGASKLSSYECYKYHTPHSASQIPITPIGGCHDGDQDHIVSTGDNCPWDWNIDQADADADGVGDVCDNCPDDVNPGQEDCDEDGVGDICDSTNIPPPIESIYFSSQTTLSWTPAFYSKRIYRGDVAAGAPFVENHVMVAELSAFTAAWTDPEIPDPGTYFYYLVTAFNGCGESN